MGGTVIRFSFDDHAVRGLPCRCKQVLDDLRVKSSLARNGTREGGESAWHSTAGHISFFCPRCNGLRGTIKSHQRCRTRCKCNFKTHQRGECMYVLHSFFSVSVLDCCSYNFFSKFLGFIPTSMMWVFAIIKQYSNMERRTRNPKAFISTHYPHYPHPLIIHGYL